MPQVKETFFENILFKFKSYSCRCVEDIEHIAPGAEPVRRFKLQAISEHPITFGYAAKDGLVRIAPNGTIEERNILGTLMSLTDKLPKELSTFFKNNGFLFPISMNCYDEMDKDTLYRLINRLRMTVELMTATNEIRKNYNQICDLTLALLFSDDQTIETSAIKTPYHSCHHSYADTIQNPPSQLSYRRQQEAFNKDTYHINDSVYGSYELNITDYNNIIGGYVSVPHYQNGFYQNPTKMFVNYEIQDMTKKISDFFFHFLHEMNGDSSAEFSKEMKNTLIEIAKFIIGEEINANLDGIHPIYNTEDMTPSWKIDSLLCAAYFSIFYLKPDLELYRPCDNPRCGRYFLVKTTSTRNKYCCQECCNRVTQDRYRKRKREKEDL